jgi:hypothetical protein
MSRVRAIDIKLIEEVLASQNGPGCILDFTNSTFSEFFRHELHIDIDDQKYCVRGSSKGKRLRAFLQIEQDTIVARALRALWEYREAINGSSATDHDKTKRFFELVHAMDGKGSPFRSGVAKAPPDIISAPSSKTLAELNCRLLTLTAMNAQERGFAFEKFLSDLFALYELDPRRSFRMVGEQIDGSFELPPETFLLEAKWQATLTGQADLLTFSGKVEGKAQWSRGMFISYSGFSEDGLEAFARGRRTSIVCMDGRDLAQILLGGLNLVDVI